MPDVALLTVHGMGETPREYAEPIFHTLRDRLGGFRWINIYDRDDALGWPLQPLSPGYAALVEDRAINAGQGW